MNIKKKIKLSFKFTIAFLIMITVLFTISYISKKSEYLDNVNKEIERYNKEVYQNFQILQNIVGPFVKTQNQTL